MVVGALTPGQLSIIEATNAKLSGLYSVVGNFPMFKRPARTHKKNHFSILIVLMATCL